MNNGSKEEVTVTGFRATCRTMRPFRPDDADRQDVKAVWVRDEYRVPCDETFTDSAAYGRHMKAHGYRLADSWNDNKTYRLPEVPAKRWRPPPRREYQPKPLDPGQPVTFAQEIPGRWTGETWGEGEWIRSETLIRTGTVWSDGPVPNSRWVVPDDEPGTYVSIKVLKRLRLTDRTLLEVMHSETWVRDTLRRVENVRRAGWLFAVVESVHRVAYSTREYKTVRWHVDPDCPLAEGRERADLQPIPARDVLPMLLGQTYTASQKYCKACIWLDPAAVENEKAVSA